MSQNNPQEKSGEKENPLAQGGRLAKALMQVREAHGEHAEASIHNSRSVEPNLYSEDADHGEHGI